MWSVPISEQCFWLLYLQCHCNARVNITDKSAHQIFPAVVGKAYDDMQVYVELQPASPLKHYSKVILGYCIELITPVTYLKLAHGGLKAVHHVLILHTCALQYAHLYNKICIWNEQLPLKGQCHTKQLRYTFKYIFGGLLI